MNTTTKYQSDFRVISRGEIQNAPYNPRKISDKAFKALKNNIKQRKLMGGIVWNEVTGNLVSDHQRLSALDALEKSKDYQIRVEVVSLTDKEEKEQNIFMNSTTVQGEFDIDILKDILPDIDYELAGLDEADLNIIGVEFMEDESMDSEGVSDIVDMQKDYAERKQEVKAKKKKYNDEMDDKLNVSSYVTISFDNYQNKNAFMKRLRFDEDAMFIKGEVLSTMIEIIK